MSTILKSLLGEDAASAIFPWSLVALGILVVACSAWGAVLAWRETVRGEPRWPVVAFFGVVGAALVVTGFWLLLGPDQRSPQEQAAAAIHRLKGEITRDENAPGKPIIKVSFRDSMFKSRTLKNADLADLRPRLEVLDELQELDLVRTNITDQGLQQLKSLTQLKTIQLGDSLGAQPGLTRSGVEELRKALPRTEVCFYEPPFRPDAETLKQFGKAIKGK